MKKHYLFLLLAVYGIAGAQVPNGSFEEFTGYGNETRFWGPEPIFISVEVPLDGGPGQVSNTIVYEPDVYTCSFFNNDAHSGERAMEIRNMFSITENKTIPGKMILFSEDAGSTTASGWNSGYPISGTTIIEGLGFYYKFFPLNNDVAQAKLELFNAGNESIGTAIVSISGLHSDYTYASSPIQLNSNDEPAFMTVEFLMSDGISDSTLGSKLIVDDVVTTNLSLSNPFFQASQCVIYPTLAGQEINVVKGSSLPDGAYGIEILTIDGKTIKKQVSALYGDSPSEIDVSSLSQGVYFIKVNESATKFIKQ